MFGALLLESSSSKTRNHQTSLNKKTLDRQFLGQRRKQIRKERAAANPAGRRPRKNNAKLSFFEPRRDQIRTLLAFFFRPSPRRLLTTKNTIRIHLTKLNQTGTLSRRFSLLVLHTQNKNNQHKKKTNIPPLFFKEGHVILNARMRKIRKF